jgi:hypothetical protein
MNESSVVEPRTDDESEKADDDEGAASTRDAKPGTPDKHCSKQNAEMARSTSAHDTTAATS